MADVTGRNIEVVEDPANAGALGAAITCAVGLGLMGFDTVKEKIKIKQRFSPRLEYAPMYERNYKVFQKLYAQNRKLFKVMNG